jgi:hypothetical protein
MVKYFIFGLQRSGTNVINTFINDNFNINICNNNYQNRKDPTHKHFRIYDDKYSIPNKTVKEQYGNDITIENYNDLEKYIGKNTKCFVVIKDVFAWFISIKKWASICKWEIDDYYSLINEYYKYVNKWFDIMKTSNGNVLIINYSEYINLLSDNNMSLIDKIEKFTNSNINSVKIRNNVQCSSTFTNERLEYYKNKEYMNKYTEEEKHKILSYK